MSDFTVKNIKDAPDVAKEHGMSPDIESRFLRSHIDSEHLGVSYFRYAPDFRPPFGHKHGVQEEAYVVISGSGRAKIEDEIVDLKQWDVLRVAPAAMRSLEAGPDGIEMIVVGSDRPEDGDGDMTPNWWAD